MATGAGPVRRKLGPIKKRLMDVLADMELLGEAYDYQLKEPFEEDVVTLRRLKLQFMTYHRTYKMTFTELLSLTMVEVNVDPQTVAERNEDEQLTQQCELLSANMADIIENVEQLIEKTRKTGLHVLQSSILENQLATSTIVANTTGPPMTPTFAAVGKNSRLPPLQLHTFSGDVLKWNQFWDALNDSVHNDTSLTDCTKLQYLIKQLTGEALEAVSGYSVTNENYTAVRKTLEELYDDTTKVIDAHIEALIEMSPASNETESFTKTFFAMESHLRSLTALKEDVTTRPYLVICLAKFLKYFKERIEERLEKGKQTTEALRTAVQHLLEIRRRSKKGPESAEKSSRPVDQRTDSSKKWIPSGGQLVQRTKTFATVTQPQFQRRISCVFFSEEHLSDECHRFSTLEARRGQLGEGRCCNCLSTKHLVSACLSPRPCVYCGIIKQHHRSLCPQGKRGPTEPNDTKETKPAAQPTMACTSAKSVMMLTVGQQSILQTAITKAINSRDGTSSRVRLLLDSASDRSYITTELATRLRLESNQKAQLTISGFGDVKPYTCTMPIVEVILLQADGQQQKIMCNVVPQITNELQRQPVSKQNWPKQFQRLLLADPDCGRFEKIQVDLMLGTDHYLQVIKPEWHKVEPSLFLLRSVFGWIVTGTQNSDQSNVPVLEQNDLLVSLLTCSQTKRQGVTPKTNVCDYDYEALWELETMGVKDQMATPAEEEALQRFNSTVSQDDSGRYEVGLCWKIYHAELPTNYGLAYGRLQTTTQKLLSTPELMEKYDETFQSQLQLGIIEKIDGTEDGIQESHAIHYLEHQAVIQPERTTTKLRIVFDGSAAMKKGGLCLNDCLHRGPLYLSDLIQLMICFRSKRIGLVADIEKAFLQINLIPSDRDATRFLWWKSLNGPWTPENVCVFRFKRLPFGLNCSPFVLAATIKHHLSHWKSEFAD